MTHKAYGMKYPENLETYKIQALWKITKMAAEVCCNQREEIDWDDIMNVLEENNLSEYWRIALEKCEEK